MRVSLSRRFMEANLGGNIEVSSRILKQYVRAVLFELYRDRLCYR